ncbi:cytochrome P450 [Saccharopolyspora sp. NPDC050642]|uniref:cytochrome P450 n=1 Tax=Saccharopolyspora sp. NPDC050642 TaxID=3157099 RepID=UPI0033CD0724
MAEPFTKLELLFQRSPEHPFHLPTELVRLREEQPLVRMTYPDGHEGWLATGYDQARAVLAHPGFSNRYELLHMPMPGITEPSPPASPGDFLGLDGPEHTRYRRLLAGKFTPRRIRLLAERVAEFTAERLDAMQRQGSPADLMELYARPIPALVICELLGVPYTDHEKFQHLAEGVVLRDGATPEDQIAAMKGLQDYISELVLAKRANPTDDVLSELTTSDLTDEELFGLGAFLLFAGLHTTASVIGMATFALLINPDQLAALRNDPDLADGAVEELLRYTGIGPCTVRAALEDAEIDGRLIKAGESVTVSMDAANRDPGKFPNPDALDLRRNATGHLTFVHGVHQCLGQHLARIELRTALPALVTRFPDLSLAIPAEKVPMHTNSNIYEVEKLPLTWTA